MKELDKIDQLFQTTFEGFELTPDPSVKTNIDQAIASKKKRRRFLFILLPLFFGSVCLAGTLYLYSSTKKSPVSEELLSQNQLREKKKKQPITSRKIVASHLSENTTKVYSESFKTRSNTAQSAPKTASHYSTIIASQKNDRTKNTATFHPKRTESSTNEPAKASVQIPPRILREESENQSQDRSDSISIASNEQKDSTNLNLLIDSINTLAAETLRLQEAKKSSAKWSLGIITGWENEKKRRHDEFDTTQFSGNPTEFARIHASTFYGKIELNRKLTNKLDLITGLGFRSSNIKQYSSLYRLDSIIVQEGVSTSVPDSFISVVKTQNGMQSYQTNAITLPLGIAYSVGLNGQFSIRLAGGTEWSYGWIKTKQIDPNTSSPRFHSFGWNVWLRPEIQYTFGKFQFIGFGSFNQALIRQLNWDFKVKRNPAFGAGIGLLIHL